MRTKLPLLLLAGALALVAGCASSVPARHPHGVMCLTFDDRNWDRWVTAMPLFAKYGAHASFFPNGPLDASALACLKRLHDGGHTVGPHTLYHADAPEFFAKHGAEKYWELQLKPQMDAFAKAGIHPRSMAYPNNKRTDETDAFLKTKGFCRFRAGYPGVRPYDPKRLKTAGLRPLAEVDEVFLPAERLADTAWMRGVGIGESYNTDIDDICAGIRRAAKNGEAIVFFSHDISPDAKSINRKTAWLERMLATARAAGMDILGFDDL